MNKCDARIAADPIYNRRKNNRDSVITSLVVIDQFLIINSVLNMQASKKRGKSIKVFTIIATRRSERFILTQWAKRKRFLLLSL